MRVRTRRALVAAAAAISLVPALTARAADRTWVAASGGSFQIPANWSGSTIPGAADTAVFDAGTSTTGYTVTFGGSVVNDAMEVDDNTTLNLTGVSYLLNHDFTAVTIGTAETGRLLTVSGGTLSSAGDIRIAEATGLSGGLSVPSGTLLFAGAAVFVAAGSGTTGSFSINGGFASGGGILVGGGGSGSVLVAGGSTLSLTSTVTVSGGSFLVSNGTVSAGSFDVASQNGDVGTFLLAASSASATANALTIGLFGGSNGTAVVNAGTLTSGTALLGGASSEGTLGHGTLLIQAVAGLSARFNNTATLSVGTGFSNTPVGGNGTMIVGGSGSRADVGTLLLGQSNSNGTVIVSHSGLLNSGTMNVGIAGDGVLRIFSGGTVVSTGSVLLASSPTATANVIVQGLGSSLTGAPVMRVGNGGTATLNILDGGSVSCGIASIATIDGGVGTVNVTGNGSTWPPR